MTNFKQIGFGALLCAGYVTLAAALGYNAYNRVETDRPALITGTESESYNLESILVAGGGLVMFGAGLYGVRKKKSDK